MTNIIDKPNSAIGENSWYLAALDHASQLADLDRPVLILGERGSGKELIAHRMHFLSSRWDEPFIKLNCAALTENLVESALFGHESGAFTGATRAQAGYFERAQAGTLFLDEIATLSLRTQEKLLRVLEYGEFERLGGQKILETNARIIAATHADLSALAQTAEFRHDLLDRLAFDVVHTPPLRLRGEDILLLAEHFAMSFVGTLGWEFFPGFSHQAQHQLLTHNWPGNVRELKNVVERSLFRAGFSHEPITDILMNPFAKPWADKMEPASATSTQNPTENFDFKGEREAWEKQQISNALALCSYHQGKTASFLGLSYDQLRALLKKLNITPKG